MSLDMCGFSLYCLKETLAADVREGRIMDEEKREYSVPIRGTNGTMAVLLPSLLFVSIMVLIPMLDALRRSFSWLPVTGLWDFKIICQS